MVALYAFTPAAASLALRSSSNARVFFQMSMVTSGSWYERASSRASCMRRMRSSAVIVDACRSLTKSFSMYCREVSHMLQVYMLSSIAHLRGLLPHLRVTDHRAAYQCTKRLQLLRLGQLENRLR